MLNQIFDVLSQSFGIFFALGLGIYLKKINALPQNTDKVLSFVLFKIIVPFLIFDVLYGLKFKKEDASLFIIVIILDIVLLLIGYVISKLLAFNSQKRTALLISLIGFSIGVVGYPFTQLNFSNEIFQRLVVVDILLLIILFILGPTFGSLANKSKKLDVIAILKSIFLEPTLIIVLVTLAISAQDIQLPEFITATSGYISPSYSFLVIFYTGIILTFPTLKESIEMSLWYLIRLTVVIIIFIVFSSQVDVSADNKIAVPLAFIAPFTSFVLYYCDKYNLDSKFVSQLSVVSIICSFIVYPIIIVILS